MKVDIFTLCDSAKEYSGKLVIVGTFNSISAPDFPAMHEELAIVARIIMDHSERGKHHLELSLKKSNEEEDVYVIKPTPMDLDNSNMTAEIGNVNLIFNAQNLLIPSEGKYVVTLKVDDMVEQTYLYVNKIVKK